MKYQYDTLVDTVEARHMSGRHVTGKSKAQHEVGSNLSGFRIFDEKVANTEHQRLFQNNTDFKRF